nr:MAG TPA: hypothetical protein [Caudoviricetes sp.]
MFCPSTIADLFASLFLYLFVSTERQTGKE